MALKENNSNEEPTIGAVAIQIVLAMSTCLPYIAYRISHNNATLWPHNGPTNPQSHCCEQYCSIPTTAFEEGQWS